MRRTTLRKVLSLVVALVMVLSMFPVPSFAAESATWTRVDAADITADDTIMVTMTNPNGVTYALYTVQEGTKGNEAKVVTVSGDTVTTDGTADYGWTVTPVDGGYTLQVDAGYLYTENTNNGVRIGETAAVWAIDGSYLSTADDGGNTRWLGVYDNNGGDYSAVATPNWRAYKNTTGNTKGQTLGFWKLTGTVAVDPSEPTGPEESTAPIADGDKVVIYAPAYGKALSTVKAGNYNAGVDVALTDGVLTGYGETEVFTVIENSDGSFSFAYEGQNLGLGDTYASMNLGAAHDDWTLTDLGNGLYNIQNVGRGNYMEWYAQYSNWSTYNSSSAATDDQFQLSFWIVTGDIPTTPDPSEPSEPEEPETATAAYMAEAPKNGDTVLIYNAANTAVMGDSLSGKKVAAVTAAAENEAITLAEGMARLLVTVDGDHYIFTLDGKYLTSAETGNGLSYADELTDCGKWTLELQEDGKWIIKNVGANYNGNYNQALEYYNGFTTYGVKTTDIYKMDFYLVEAAKQEGIVTELNDGDTVVIFNPANLKALSTDYAGTFYNQGTDVTLADGKLSGYTAADVWTVGVNDDGTYTFSTAAGQKLSMGTSYSSMPLDDVNTAWTIENAATENCFYIKNAARGNYIEWYADKSNWSSYSKISDEALFAQMFYLVLDSTEEPETNLPADGDQVVIYNLAAEGVLAAENDTQSIENALTTVTDGVATPANGGVVFTVSKNGDYYRFFNETYGYLCSGGTGNNAFYSLEASDDADWTLLEGKSGGWNLESRTAKYNGTYSQYLEYYADSYKTYSMYNVTDYDIYEFFFYPVAENVNLSGGIVNQPQFVFEIPAPIMGQDWVFTFTADAVFGIQSDIDIMIMETLGDGSDSVALENAYTLSGPDVSGVYTVTVPASILELCGDVIYVSVDAVDNTGYPFGNWFRREIIDEPSIADITPAAGAETGADKRPVISAVIVNAGEGATATMTVNGEAVEATYENGVISWQSAADMADGRVSVTVTVTRADGKTASKSWSFTVGEKQYELYFGQLHSHTTYSDGSGSLESALEYIGSLPESANVDFVAFTDHSNYFDTTGSANPEGALYDMGLASADSQSMWSAYKGAIADFNAAQQNVVAIGGFEMTWSGGPGHINTFATPGIVSRNNATLNNKTSDAGMKAYYALLSQPEGIDSISQFNHPGTTFGNFSDFAYWDALVDTRIQLVEVGNGEGQVGAGGYYPSYEQYTMALDKGWHVAPTNNQDNHKGKWGNANDARDVILTDDFSEEGIYNAIRAYRVYATEDKNLEIGYTVNGQLLGSVIEEVPEILSIEVTTYDPDASDSISKVEVIVNSGKVAHTWDDPAVLAAGTLTVELAPDYSYYYIRVTEGDGDIAVTAPVWVGETLKLGISAVECGTSTPVTGEELTISTTLFNSETAEASVKSLTYTVGSQVLGVDTTGYTIPASGNCTVNFAYTPDVAKVMNVTVTAVVELEGVEYTFSMDVQLDVQDSSKLVYIGIDASHYNEYVNGNYKDSMGNFGALAAEYSVRTVTLNTSEDLIAACGNEKYVALILTAPSRRSAEAQAADPLKVYTAEELAAIQAFNSNGGTVILAGWSDHYENYPSVESIANMDAAEHMAATQNAVLEALGSSLRIGDDATYDDDYNGGQAYRLYFNAYNYDSFLVEGVEVDDEHPHDRLYTEVYSHYGGASVYTVDGTLPETVTPIVFGHSGTYSVDVDKDGLGGETMPKYTYAEGDDRLVVLASEQLEGKGLIIVSGAAFMSNFEVQATIEDSGSEKNYSNYKVCENLLKYLNPVTITDIADVQAETEEGVKYTIEGVITSNASGYDKDTAFFDCIYLQDETAGINAFPVAGNYKIGDKVRITGTTSSYQGERQIAVTSIELISEGNEVAPTEITAAQLNDGSVLGSLVTLSGTVESFAYANGLVQTIMVKDENGDVGRIFIDGYITTSYDVAHLLVGRSVTVTGLASYDNSFDGPAPRIRVRDRNDVVCTVKFVDVADDAWYHDAVYAAVDAGIIEGITATTFAPEFNLNRAQWVTMLYRAADKPAVTEPSTFTDVPADAYYADAIAWAEDVGIFKGIGGGLAAPEVPITREQMVTMLYRYSGETAVEADLSDYDDAAQISDYALDAFRWAVANGHINGMDASTLAPYGQSTRAQAVVVLARYLDLI